MKGKFRILGLGLGAFLVCALMLALIPAAPAAASSVTNVWVEFPFTAGKNATSSTANQYYIHFKPTTALVRGADYVTVTFPDGTSTMGGTGSAYAFTLATTMGASEVSFSTDYGTSTVTSATWTATTATPTVGGYRAKVKTPIDVAAGTDVWIKFASDDITSASTEGSSYKVYVATTKDTTPVLSSAFALGDSVCTALTTSISPATAGAASQYTFTFTPATNLTADTDTVTVMFPVGTTLPSSISASNVQFSSDGSSYTAAGTTPTVDTNTRQITATVSVALNTGGSRYMRVLSGANVTNPTTASSDDYYAMIRTSQDGKYYKASAAHTVSAGSATKVVVANGEIGLTSTYYSDDATMINMYSHRIFLVLTDDYGNAKAPASAVTVSLSSSSGTGAFYTNASDDGSGAMTSATTVSLDAATPDAGQTVYYKDTAAGTYTFTFSATGYTSATWTFKVCPAVSLYDASNNLVSTYAPSSTSPAAETATTTVGSTLRSKVSADYIGGPDSDITGAIEAAMAGDTVKLGDGIYEVDSDSYINLNKKVTLTSVNGASATTLRPTADNDDAIKVGVAGTATNPVIIDGLTFSRLRANVEFDQAVYNNGFDYVTVRNCVFNYVMPANEADHEHGAVVGFIVYTAESGGGAASITSATVSNNTFTGCGGSFTTGAKPGVIRFMSKTSGYTISGVTISGNTLTNCNGYGIALKGYYSGSTVRASITNNTLTNGVGPLSIQGYTTNVSITGNTVTGGYQYGLRVETDDHDSLVIKNNTITGCCGVNGAVRIDADGGATANTIQYNDINNPNAEYNIYVASGIGAQDCKYNWFGDATGPYYSALTGATVTKSNPNGTGTKVTDLVTYYPWLHKSRADVVADNASYQACTIKLGSGWNTLSTPVKLISAADAVNELIPSGMTIGYYYSGGWQQITTGYVLNPCDAVYVKMSAEKYVLLKFDASAFSTPSKSLAAGWNLISLASLDSDGMYADLAVASVAKTAAGLPGYSQVISPSINATQTDIYGNTGTSWTVSYGQTSVTSNMFASLGYWVYMQNAATLAGFEITPIAPDLD